MNFSIPLILVIACSMLLAAGCASQSPARTPAFTTTDVSREATTPHVQIWVLDSGWHTGLVLSRAELGPDLDRLLQPATNAYYFMFGWGNRKFYMAPSPGLGMDIEALFPSKSTVLIESCENPPRECYTSAIRFHIVNVSVAGLDKLDNYLVQSLQTDMTDKLQALGPGPDAGSEFYASGFSYDAFHTCNTWTAKALYTAGVSINYHGVIFADQLWRQLK